MDPYADFAADYEWFFDDEGLTGVNYLSAYSAVLDTMPAGAAVLDVACGIGVESAALAQRGFRVAASDASPAMVEHARSRLEPFGVVPVVARWDELGDRFDPVYDLVVCNGNSLMHAGGEAATRAALIGMHSVLKPHGHLVVGSRNFEYVRSRTARVEVRPRTAQRDGTTCVVVNVWDIPDSWNQTHRLTITFVWIDEDSNRSRSHVIDFIPYRHDDLLEWIAASGFDPVTTDRTDEDPVYTVVARRR